MDVAGTVLCVEGDGRAALDNFWCGACHMAAQREMEGYQAERAGPPCDWIERAIRRFKAEVA